MYNVFYLFAFPAVRRLRVSGGAAGFHLRGSRRAQRPLRSDGGAGGAFGRAAWLVSGEDDRPNASAGNEMDQREANYTPPPS